MVDRRQAYNTAKDSRPDFYGIDPTKDIANGNWVEKLYKQLGGNKLGEDAGWTFVREMAYLITEFVENHGHNLVDHRMGEIPSELDFTGEGGASLTDALFSDNKAAKTKAAITLTTQAAVIVAQPVWELNKAHSQDKELREAIREEIAPLIQNNIVDFRSSSVLPGGKNHNKVLEKLDGTLQTPFNYKMINMLGSLGMAGAQKKARDTFREDRAQGIIEERDSRLENENLNPKERKNINDKAETALKGKIFIPDAMSLRKENIFGKKEDDRFAVYDNKLNATNAWLIGGLIGTSQIKKMAEESKEHGSPDVIAYDLIIHLQEEVSKGKLGDDISIEKLKKMHPKHKFHCPAKGNKVKLSDYIQEIFHQHVVDHRETPDIEGVSEEYEQELAERSETLAQAILGKDGSNVTLHPLSLITLVGEGLVVSHDGFDVSDPETLETAIQEARHALPGDRAPEKATVPAADKKEGKNNITPRDKKADAPKENAPDTKVKSSDHRGKMETKGKQEAKDTAASR